MLLILLVSKDRCIIFNKFKLLCIKCWLYERIYFSCL